jgi:CheY-like chemotaxis protein
MKKIILVSSSAAFLERNSHLLKRKEFLIFTVNSGAEAIRIHQDEQVNLVLAELHLSDMGGDRLCTLIRAMHPALNVAVILTCHDIEAELLRAEQSKPNAVMVRPIQPMQLVKAVERFLEFPLVRRKRASLKVDVVSRKGGATFSCQSLNISVMGVLVQSDCHLDIGDTLDCQFSLPGQNDIKVKGEVARTVQILTGGRQYGIRFIDLSHDIYRKIECFVEASDGEGAEEGLAGSGLPG